jgi:hypothetical protein
MRALAMLCAAMKDLTADPDFVSPAAGAGATVRGARVRPVPRGWRRFVRRRAGRRGKRMRTTARCHSHTLGGDIGRALRSRFGVGRTRASPIFSKRSRRRCQRARPARSRLSRRLTSWPTC